MSLEDELKASNVLYFIHNFDTNEYAMQILTNNKLNTNSYLLPTAAHHVNVLIHSDNYKRNEEIFKKMNNYQLNPTYSSL